MIKKYVLFFSLLSVIFVFTMVIIEREYLASEDFKIIVPICKINTKVTTKDYHKAAGCLIVDEDKILMVQKPFTFIHFLDSWKFSIPGGKALPGEDSQCTATRETFEETGVAVEVVSLIQQYDNYFNLFECRPVKPITEENLLYSKTFEVKKLEWVKIDDLETRRLRFADQFPELIKMLHKRKEQKQISPNRVKK